MAGPTKLPVRMRGLLVSMAAVEAQEVADRHQEDLEKFERAQAEKLRGNRKARRAAKAKGKRR